MTRVYWIIAVGLVILAWGISAALYPGLPAKIPTHYNLQGKVDAYGSKGTIFLMPAVMIFLLGLFQLLPVLSPKGFEVDTARTTYLFVMVLVIGMQGYIQGVILYGAAMGGKLPMARVMLAGLFLFFALMGNVLGRVRRNFYIGVRVPWTLASERVWNDTHRVSAWLFVACGLAGFVVVISGLPLLAALAVLPVAVLGPIVYAFVHYKRLERRGAL
jgi:uncharacterized membrane protein